MFHVKRLRRVRFCSYSTSRVVSSPFGRSTTGRTGERHPIVPRRAAAAVHDPGAASRETTPPVLLVFGFTGRFVSLRSLNDRGTTGDQHPILMRQRAATVHDPGPMFHVKRLRRIRLRSYSSSRAVSPPFGRSTTGEDPGHHCTNGLARTRNDPRRPRNHCSTFSESFTDVHRADFAAIVSSCGAPPRTAGGSATSTAATRRSLSEDEMTDSGSLSGKAVEPGPIHTHVAWGSQAAQRRE